MDQKDQKEHRRIMDEIAGGELFAEGFAPVAGNDARVLILGSMPSLESLRCGCYYANRRNHFWPLMFRIFKRPFEEQYERRIGFLMEIRVALWDVLSGCKRKGSLDSAIREEQYNDLAGFLGEHQGISTIFFNGRKAESSFGRYLRHNPGVHPLMEQKRQEILPSSSPVPTRIMKRMEDKLPAWQRLTHAAEDC